jgi:hypothetical protein
MQGTLQRAGIHTLMSSQSTTGAEIPDIQTSKTMLPCMTTLSHVQMVLDSNGKEVLTFPYQKLGAPTG